MRLLLAIALVFLLAPWVRSLVAPDLIMGTSWPSGGPMTETETVLSASGERIRHGQYRSWYESGALSCEGQFMDGRREGTWRWWHETGEPLGVCTYEADFGQYTGWFPDGRLHLRGPQRGPRREGLWTEYYPSGRVHLTGGYREDRQHGLWTFQTDEDPPVKVTAYFEDGRRLR
jgi:antitoxin component YwqK of YwqJK toxin-antitoxin module